MHFSKFWKSAFRSFNCKVKVPNKLINNDIDIEFDKNATPASFRIE